MAGIYIHIPFCRQACSYCDFYFTTQLRHRSQLVEALCKELELQQNYFDGLTIHTIYFGGGTPSVLTPQELGVIFKTIKVINTIKIKEYKRFLLILFRGFFSSLLLELSNPTISIGFTL